jgi:hypothetical protein
MGLIAAFLIPIVLFFWFAFMFSIWCWLQVIFCLFQCKFIRASLWFNAGTFMLFWWFEKPHDWDTMMPGIVFFTGLGALGTFMRFYRRHQRAAEAVPPFEPAPVVLNINIELNTNSHADRRAVHDDLAALASALRGAIGPEQGPRRISGPTVN